MGLSIGIVGLPNVGKSTLFNALTDNQVLAANYPFATIDANVGVVPVPDPRLGRLAALYDSERIVPATVTFVDIAGLVKGASTGQGLGNQFLSHIRETNAVAQVLRCFANADIIHVEESVNPLRDMDIINSELMLKDLDTVQKRMTKTEGEVRTGNKEKVKELETLKIVLSSLEKEQMPYLLDKEILETPVMKELNLLTAKPQLYVLNGKESDVSEELTKKIADMQCSYVVLDLESEPDLAPLITKAYAVLNLISFFTTGEDETRAWTIENGWKAPQAAGTIHTDFEHKFIRAEVVAYDDFVATGGWTQAKQKGKLRVEGKDYVIKDGDIIEVRHG